jgi:hypothetical protein
MPAAWYSYTVYSLAYMYSNQQQCNLTQPINEATARAPIKSKLVFDWQLGDLLQPNLRPIPQSKVYYQYEKVV